MVAPHPVSARSVAQNSEGGTRNKIKSLSLRGSTLSDYELWQFAIRETFLSNDVSHLVDHGFKEVTIDMVTFLHPEVGTGEAASLLTQYQLQYQSDQRVLFRLIQESVDFAGPHQAQDMRYLQRQFTRSDLRDGLGFWKWIATFFDQTSFDAQRKLSVQVNDAKIKITASLNSLELFATTLLEKWCLIKGNLRSQPAAFNEILLRAFPPDANSTPILYSLRIWLAEEIYKNPAECRNAADPDALIRAITVKAQQLGLPPGSIGPAAHTEEMVLGIMPRGGGNGSAKEKGGGSGSGANAAEPISSERCSYCNCRTCSAGSDKAKCLVYNTSLALPRGQVAKAVVELSREFARKNPGKPNVKSYKLKLSTAKAKADKDGQAPDSSGGAGAVTAIVSSEDLEELNADDLGTFWDQLSAANGIGSDGSVCAIRTTGAPPGEGEEVVIEQDTAVIADQIQQLKQMQNEMREQIAAATMLSEQRNGFTTPAPARSLALTPIAPATTSPSAPPSPAPSPGLAAPSPALPLAQAKPASKKPKASGTTMIAAGLHQTSKENDERSAALQQAGQYRISQLAYNACGYVKEILTPVIKGARDFAVEADARNLIIACYALNRLRPYITPAVRHLFLDVTNRVHHYLTRFVASAGSSAATVALGSLLTVYNQSRNFLASAGSVLAAPSAAAVALSAAPVNTPISPAPGSAVSTDEAARAAPKKSDNSRGPKGSDGGAGPAPAEHCSGGGGGGVRAYPLLLTRLETTRAVSRFCTEALLLLPSTSTLLLLLLTANGLPLFRYSRCLLSVL